MSDLHTFLSITEKEFLTFLKSIEEVSLKATAKIIWDSENKGGRLHITGIGKPAHVASYIASLISSTGTPAYFLHGTEAVHGSCGQLSPNDVVICISNSGETVEMKATAQAIRQNGCRIIAVTGHSDSWLAEIADAHIFAGVEHEGGPLNRAPRNSILAEILALQALSVVLQEKRAMTPQEYVMRHPGGSLGTLRDNEK